MVTLLNQLQKISLSIVLVIFNTSKQQLNRQITLIKITITNYKRTELSNCGKCKVRLLFPQTQNGKSSKGSIITECDMRKMRRMCVKKERVHVERDHRKMDLRWLVAALNGNQLLASNLCCHSFKFMSTKFTGQPSDSPPHPDPLSKIDCTYLLPTVPSNTETERASVHNATNTNNRNISITRTLTQPVGNSDKQKETTKCMPKWEIHSY
eukprot:TRINITY_DN33493_c0_g1_i4.p1 TRINITY_DN33493_c0_g1~~TRINITY_DN33493_c0_g1_i4.p1  ORF type:complete len:210 (+),score=-11.22 TRINITY_DN33493_c0_g1_i4:164-793(+)